MIPERMVPNIPANDPKTNTATISTARNHIGKTDFPGLFSPISATAAANMAHKSAPMTGLALSGKGRLMTLKCLFSAFREREGLEPQCLPVALANLSLFPPPAPRR